MTAGAPAPVSPGGPATVVNLRGHRDAPDIADVIYVGRPMYRGGWRLPGHPLASPYRTGRDGTGAQAVGQYRRWLLARPETVDSDAKRLADFAAGLIFGPRRGQARPGWNAWH